MVRRGFYRHYKGHVYYVFGVGFDHHAKPGESQRKVVYTSVKTENKQYHTDEEYDFLLRDPKEFDEYVDPKTGERCDERHSCVCTSCVPRFQSLTDPEWSKLPDPYGDDP